MAPASFRTGPVQPSAESDVIVVHCSDARFQPHFQDFLKQGLGVERYLLLAVPGGPQFLTLTEYLPKFSWVGWRWLKFLADLSKPRRVILIGHGDCRWYLHSRFLHVARSRSSSASLPTCGRCARHVRRAIPGRRGRDVLREAGRRARGLRARGQLIAPCLSCASLGAEACSRRTAGSVPSLAQPLRLHCQPMATPRTIRTVCPRNCYCTCGMLVTVEDGRITNIEGDPLNPATGGHVCLKGISYARRQSADERILTPLRRTSAGSFERVSWDSALTDIAERLDRLRRRDGPESVLYYEASGSHGALGRLAMAFWRQFGGCTLTYGDLCWPAGLEATRLTYGINHHNHPRLTVDSRFILLWGHNPAETNIHQMRLVLDAQERGARIALIDPRSTDTSDAADVHLKPRPGTDAALALGLARIIVDEGLHDRQFLERHATGVERYLERLREFPLDRAAAVTGLDARDIRDLARCVRHHETCAAHCRLRPAAPPPRRPDDARGGAAAGADGQRRRCGRRLAVREPGQPLCIGPAAATGAAAHPAGDPDLTPRSDPWRAGSPSRLGDVD